MPRALIIESDTGRPHSIRKERPLWRPLFQALSKQMFRKFPSSTIYVSSRYLVYRKTAPTSLFKCYFLKSDRSRFPGGMHTLV